jgi:hypothetical protein
MSPIRQETIEAVTYTCVEGKNKGQKRVYIYAKGDNRTPGKYQYSGGVENLSIVPFHSLQDVRVNQISGGVIPGNGLWVQIE